VGVSFCGQESAFERNGLWNFGVLWGMKNATF